MPERAEIPFTYTYDQCTVFFHDDRVFIGGEDVSLGQCCVGIMELEDAVLDEIERRVRAFGCSQKKQTAPQPPRRRN